MTWAYLTEKKQRIEVSSRELKALAKSGTIHKMTYVFTPEGRCARAGKIRGLHFPESIESAIDDFGFNEITEKIQKQAPQTVYETPIEKITEFMKEDAAAAAAKKNHIRTVAEYMLISIALIFVILFNIMGMVKFMPPIKNFLVDYFTWFI